MSRGCGCRSVSAAAFNIGQSIGSSGRSFSSFILALAHGDSLNTCGGRTSARPSSGPATLRRAAMLGLHENYKSIGATVGLVFLLCLSVWPRNTLLFLLIAALYVVPIAIGGWCINRIAEHIRPCLDTMDDWFIKNDYSSMRSWNICKPDTCPGKICMCTTWLVLWVPFMYFCLYFYAVLPLPFGGGTVVDLSEQLMQRQGSESNATSAPEFSQFGLVLDTLNVGIYRAFFYLFLRLLVPLGFDRYLGAHRWLWWQSRP